MKSRLFYLFKDLSMMMSCIVEIYDKQNDMFSESPNKHLELKLAHSTFHDELRESKGLHITQLNCLQVICVITFQSIGF